jgi:hypothetical protein
MRSQGRVRSTSSLRALRLTSASFGGLLLIATAAYLEAQQKGAPTSKCLVCTESKPGPAPAPSPVSNGDWEAATNCVPVRVRPSSDPDEALVRCTIERGDSFKVKASSKISSSTAREGDFVGFVVAQDVRSSIDPNYALYQRGRIIIAKDSLAFGIVLERKHRHFPFVNGKLNISLGAVTASDGTVIPVYIDRFKCPRCLQCLIKEGKSCDAVCSFSPYKSDKRSTICNTDVAPQYVSGRADRNVAPVIQALALTALAFVGKRDDPSVRTIALFTLASQVGIAELLNGTDAEIQAGDVFEAYVTARTDVIITAKKPVFMKKSGDE